MVQKSCVGFELLLDITLEAGDYVVTPSGIMCSSFVKTRSRILVFLFILKHAAVIKWSFQFVYVGLLKSFAACCVVVSTHSHDPCLWGGGDNPAFGPPASISLVVVRLSVWSISV